MLIAAGPPGSSEDPSGADGGRGGRIAGAKIYYAILFRDWHLLFDRAGLVWYGGFIGGVLAVSILFWRKGVDYFTAVDGAAPALAIGYALGRIGCFLVGDDYGRPTNSWVGIAFPKGSPPTTAESLRQFGVHVDPSIPADQVLRVHPTQIYESAAAFVIAFILLAAARRPHTNGRIRPSSGLLPARALPRGNRPGERRSLPGTVHDCAVEILDSFYSFGSGTLHPVAG